MISLLRDTKLYILENYNSNFHYNNLPWIVKVWLEGFAYQTEKRLRALERKHECWDCKKPEMPEVP